MLLIAPPLSVAIVTAAVVKKIKEEDRSRREEEDCFVPLLILLVTKIKIKKIRLSLINLWCLEIFKIYDLDWILHTSYGHGTIEIQLSIYKYVIDQLKIFFS